MSKLNLAIALQGNLSKGAKGTSPVGPAATDAIWAALPADQKAIRAGQKYVLVNGALLTLEVHAAAVLKANETLMDEQLADALKAEGFMGAEWEYPGFVALYKVPGLEEIGYYLYATPWWNSDNELDFNLNDPTGDVIFADSAPFIAQESPESLDLAALVSMYKRIITQRLPEFVAAAQKDKAEHPDKKAYTGEGAGLPADDPNEDLSWNGLTEPFQEWLTKSFEMRERGEENKTPQEYWDAMTPEDKRITSKEWEKDMGLRPRASLLSRGSKAVQHAIAWLEEADPDNAPDLDTTMAEIKSEIERTGNPALKKALAHLNQAGSSDDVDSIITQLRGSKVLAAEAPKKEKPLKAIPPIKENQAAPKRDQKEADHYKSLLKDRKRPAVIVKNKMGTEGTIYEAKEVSMTQLRDRAEDFSLAQWCETMQEARKTAKILEEGRQDKGVQPSSWPTTKSPQALSEEEIKKLPTETEKVNRLRRSDVTAGRTLKAANDEGEDEEVQDINSADEAFERSSDSYSRDRYEDKAWKQIIESLIAKGFTPQDAYDVLMSKYPRWVGDSVQRSTPTDKNGKPVPSHMHPDAYDAITHPITFKDWSGGIKEADYKAMADMIREELGREPGYKGGVKAGFGDIYMDDGTRNKALNQANAIIRQLKAKVKRYGLQESLGQRELRHYYDDCVHGKFGKMSYSDAGVMENLLREAIENIDMHGSLKMVARLKAKLIALKADRWSDPHKSGKSRRGEVTHTLDDFIRGIDEVKQASMELMQIWDGLDEGDADLVVNKYPFGMDFEMEWPAALMEWRHSIEEKMDANDKTFQRDLKRMTQPRASQVAAVGEPMFEEVTGDEPYKVVDLETGGESYHRNKEQAYKMAAIIKTRLGHNYRIEVRQQQTPDSPEDILNQPGVKHPIPGARRQVLAGPTCSICGDVLEDPSEDGFKKHLEEIHSNRPWIKRPEGLSKAADKIMERLSQQKPKASMIKANWPVWSRDLPGIVVQVWKMPDGTFEWSVDNEDYSVNHEFGVASSLDEAKTASLSSASRFESVEASIKGSLEVCDTCGRKLDPEKGDAFLTDDGGVYCNDCFPGDDGEEDGADGDDSARPGRKAMKKTKARVNASSADAVVLFKEYTAKGLAPEEAAVAALDMLTGGGFAGVSEPSRTTMINKLIDRAKSIEARLSAGVDDLEVLLQTYLAARDAREANSEDPAVEQAFLEAQSKYRTAKAASEKAFFEEFNKAPREARAQFDEALLGPKGPMRNQKMDLPKIEGAIIMAGDPFKAKGFNGTYHLMDDSGAPVTMDEKVTGKNGDGWLHGGTAPQREGDPGLVVVKSIKDPDDDEQSYYPTVYGLHWELVA